MPEGKKAKPQYLSGYVPEVTLPTEPSIAPRISVYPPKPSAAPPVPYRDIEQYKTDIINKGAYWYEYALKNYYEVPFERLVSQGLSEAEADAQVKANILSVYGNYKKQALAFIDRYGLNDYTLNAESLLRNFISGKTEREILSYQSQKRDEALAIPTFENRRDTILSNPDLNYQQKQSYITNLAWELRDKGVSDTQIQTLIREAIGGEFANKLAEEQKALARPGSEAVARASQRHAEQERELSKVPQYQTAFESVAQGSQPWKSWFESQYPSLVSRFKLTLPEVPTTAKTMEKSWADWLAKKTPELKEEFASLPSSYRGERPWAYAPAIKTVRF